MSSSPTPPTSGVPVPRPPESLIPRGVGDYRRELASQLVFDLEQHRLAAEPLLYKALRLANAAGDSLMEEWIGYELAGYPSTVPTNVMPMIESTGRLERRNSAVALVSNAMAEAAKQFGNRSDSQDEALSGQDITVTIHRESLPSIEDHLLPMMDDRLAKSATTRRTLEQQAKRFGRKLDPALWAKSDEATRGRLVTLASVAKKVRRQLHGFAVSAFHRFAFDEVANAIFERHRNSVDTILTQTAPEVIEKIPAIYDRLVNGDSEAVSQAMSSCRRMIAAFADIVYPAQQDSDREGGTEHTLKQSAVLNRIQQYMKERIASGSRIDRLNKTLRGLYERVSAGMKSDITAEEAQSLFILTYMTLGEIAAAARVQDVETA